MILYINNVILIEKRSARRQPRDVTKEVIEEVNESNSLNAKFEITFKRVILTACGNTEDGNRRSRIWHVDGYR